MCEVGAALCPQPSMAVSPGVARSRVHTEGYAMPGADGRAASGASVLALEHGSVSRCCL